MLYHTKKFSTLQETLISCYRRALAFPLYRNYKLCDKILQDVYILLKLGKRAILKALLEIKDMFDHHDIYYIYNKIWLDDYCIWIQQSR
jgi:protein SHQ1